MKSKVITAMRKLTAADKITLLWKLSNKPISEYKIRTRYNGSKYMGAWIFPDGSITILGKDDLWR